MSTRRRPRQRYLRSPIQPGAFQINGKTVFSMLPLILLLFGLVGSWYLQKDRLQRVEHDAAELKAQVEVLRLERAAEGDDHMLLLKIREDLEKLKRKAGLD